MVDAEARQRAAALVQQLRSGAITNNQFEDAYPMKSKDRALFAVFIEAWSRYDDLREHRLQDLPDGVNQRLLRCEAFLRTNCRTSGHDGR
jgi:hypothetical protein